MAEKNQVLDAIQRLGRNIKRRSKDLNPGSHGRGQGKTLQLIAQYEGIRANDLALLLDIRPSSLTQKLDKLEEDGNICRKRDSRDARVVHIYTTIQGRGALELRKQERQHISRDFSDCLTEEEKELFCNLCHKLSDNLEKINLEEKERHKKVLKMRAEKEAVQTNQNQEIG